MASTTSNLAFCAVVSDYAAQACVMHRSLRSVLPEARTEVLCVKPGIKAALEKLAIPGLHPIGIEELERRDPELAEVRRSRTPREYCQTAKPAFCLDVLARNPAAEWVTYLDTDMMFFSDPRPLFDELRASSVGIVPHRFAPRFRNKEATSGPFCSAWVSFASDPHGVAVARSWRAGCLEWCSFRPDLGRLADQEYLRDWPERFEGVHVLTHPGIGPAPWTDNRSLSRNGQVTIEGHPLIAFHYQSLKIYRPTLPLRQAHALPGAPVPLAWHIFRGYRVSAKEREIVWDPYLRRLGEALGELRAIAPEFVDGLRGPSPRVRMITARVYLRMLWDDLARRRPRIFARFVKPEQGRSRG